MSLPRDAMLDLMAYADGELEGAERARIEDLVRSSDEARRIVESMRSIGDVVRELPESGAESSPRVLAIADGIADDVMKAIAREPAVGRGGEKAGDAGPSKAAGAVVSLDQKRAEARARYVAMAVGALALAAGTFVVLRGVDAPGPTASEAPHEAPPIIQPPPGASQPPPTGTAPTTLAQAAPVDDPGAAAKDGVDVEEVESGGTHNVSVFYVPSSLKGAAASASSVVIWIDDHGGH